jgi:hypothetical protein
MEQEIAADLYQDHLDRMAEEHTLKHDEPLRQYLEAERETAERTAVNLADAAYRKHGNYPAALIDVCRALVDWHGVEVVGELTEIIHRDKDEADSSPF